MWSRSAVRRIFTATLAAGMVVSWSLQAVAQSAGGSVESDTTRATEFNAQIQRSLMAIEDGRRQAPRDRWDPQYVVDTVGIDPGALYGFVRDNVGWIPYRGTLRGPVGVLMDRTGNSLDMSLLLADLIARTGRQVRLAHATLDGAALDALWDDFRSRALVVRLPAGNAGVLGASPLEPSDGRTGSIVPPRDDRRTERQMPEGRRLIRLAQASNDLGVADDSGFGGVMGGSGSMFDSFTGGSNSAAPPAAANDEEAAALYDLDKTAAKRKLEEALTSRGRDAEELDRRTLEQGSRLLSLFAGSQDGAQRAYEQEKARAALSDHWWVQVNEGGRWTDYDLLALEGSPGTALSTAGETMAPDAIPTGLRHRVGLKVIAEQLLGGRLHENAVFEHDFIPSDVIGKRISLRHLPMMWPADWQAVTPDDVQEKLFAALYTQKEWMPGLTVGGEAFQQSSVLDTGAVNPNPQPQSNPFLSIAFPVAGKVGRVADLFDDLLDGTASPEDVAAEAALPGDAPRANGELTAEWLEYTVVVPGEAPKTVRREVFDILGPAMRAGGDLSKFRMDEDKLLARAGGAMTETDLVILPSWPAASFLADMTAELALANKPLLDELTRDPFGKAPANSVELFSKMSGMAGPAYLYSSLRADVRSTVGSVFVDRPQVVAQHGVLTRVGPGEMTAKAALDVVENGVGADPFADDPFVLRVLQGVADTNAEALALPDGGENVGEAYKLAATEPQWSVFFPEDRERLNQLGLPPDLMARLLADLDAGQAVVSPSGSAKNFERAGWWRVNLADGTTLGMGNRGWGSVLVEYAFYLTIQAMLAQISCMAFTAAAEEKINKLTAEQGREKVKEWAKSCVKQALLETISGLSTSWISSRFIDGAHMPTWNKTSKGGSSHTMPHTSSMSHNGSTPHPNRPAPHASNGPAPHSNSASSNGPHSNGSSPHSSPQSRTGEPHSTGNNQPPSRNPASQNSSASNRGHTEPVRQQSPKASTLPGTDPAHAPTQPQPAHPSANPSPQQAGKVPQTHAEKVDAVKSQSSDHVAAHNREVEAANRMIENPSLENRRAYEDSVHAADATRKQEAGDWYKNGGNGLPPSHGSGELKPMPDVTKVPPLPGTEPTHQMPAQPRGTDVASAPTVPQQHGTQQMGGSPTVPQPAQSPSGGRNTQVEGSSPTVPQPAHPGASQSASNSGHTEPVRQQSPKASTVDNMPARPLEPAPSPKAHTVDNMPARPLEPAQGASPAQVSHNTNGRNGPATLPGTGPGQQQQPSNRGSGPSTLPGTGPGQANLPSHQNGNGPATLPGIGPSQANAPAAQPGHSPKASTVDNMPARPLEPAPSPKAHTVDNMPARPLEPAPQQAGKVPQTHAEKVDAVKSQSSDHVAAHNREVEAANRMIENPSLENRRAYEDSVHAADATRKQEAGDWYKNGGNGLPPSHGSGELKPMPDVTKVPPLPGTEPTHQMPAQPRGTDVASAPTVPQQHGTQQMGGSPTVPQPAQSPSGGRNTQVEGSSPTVPQPAHPGASQSASNSGHTEPVRQQSPKASTVDNMPARPLEPAPSPKAHTVDNMPARPLEPAQGASPAQVSHNTNGRNGPATLPGTGPGQQQQPSNRGSGPSTLPGTGPGQANLPSHQNGNGPATLPGIGPSQANAPAAQPGHSPKASTVDNMPARPLEPAPSPKAHTVDNMPARPLEPAPQQAAKVPQTHAEKVDAIKPYTSDRVEAERRYAEAERQYAADPSRANYDAFDKANDDYNRAHMREVDAWARAGGTGFPPTRSAPGAEAASIQPAPVVPGGNGPATLPGIGPQQEGSASAGIQRQEAGTPAENGRGTLPGVGPQPATAAPSPADADRVAAIKPLTDERVAAERRYAEAEERYLADRSQANYDAFDQANDAYNRAHMQEVDAWARNGGNGFPPTKNPVLAAQLPVARVASPEVQTGANSTLAMGLAALAGTVQKGP